MKSAFPLAVALVLGAVGGYFLARPSCCGDCSAQPPVRKPTTEDLATLTDEPSAFVDRLLSVIEKEIVPLTQEGVRKGNKLFGAAVLDKSDLSTVIASTNNETGNPINHGEVQCVNEFYAVPRDQRPTARGGIFIATHEPCPLCLSAISWSGFDNFFYLFSYEDTKEAFNIPHDLRMLEEVFRCPDGSYSEKNHYWVSWGIRDLIAMLPEAEQAAFTARVEALRQTYDEMSEIYQQSKSGDAEIPLK